MSGIAPRWRWFADKFGIRLGLILTLALVPVGIIALVQSAGIDAEVRARTRAALTGQTLAAASPRVGQMLEAQGTARTLARTLPLLPPEQCQSIVQDMTGPGGNYLFAAYYQKTGLALCTSRPGMADVSRRPFFSDFADAPRAMLRMIRSEDGGATPDLLVAIAPVTNADGSDAGFVAVAPLQGRRIRVDDGDNADFNVVLFDRNGNILSASVGLSMMEPLLPRENPLKELFGQPDRLFSGPDGEGRPRLYSLTALLPEQVYAIGSWPEQTGRLNGWSPLLLPAAMWAISLIAAWLAAEIMVTRHMRRFRHAITAFAHGDRRLRPMQIATAPREIREAAYAFENMTETILKDEADLENSVRDKEALLREVHHRVKNNLQLMASIINLQLRRTRSEDAKGIMRRLQDRMLSLATIHNNLFHTSTLNEVQVEPLFAGIVDQITVSGAGAGQRFDIAAAFEPIAMTPEQVVPLALLITEALGWAMKTSLGTGEALPRIEIILTKTPDGRATLTIISPVAPDADGTEQDHDDTALGNQLIHAFALQLGGSFQRNIGGNQQVQRLEFQVKQNGSLPPGQVPQG